MTENAHIGRSRDLRLDTMKGLLIILVVFGHIIEPVNPVQPYRALFMAIYSFHMPLFILLSGYVFDPGMDKRKLIKGNLRLFEALTVFQCFRLAVLYMHGELSIKALITPYAVLWYIFSLIIWRTVTCVLLTKAGRNRLPILIILSFVAAIAVGFIPVFLEFSFQRTFAFYSFFLLGIIMKQKQPSKRICAIGGGIILIISAMLLCVFIPYDSSFANTFTYFYRPYGPFTDILCRISTLGIALGASLILFTIIPKVGWLAKLGAETLVIYLIHYILIGIFYHRVFNTHLLPVNLIVLAIMSGIITLALFILSKTKVAKFIVNPISTIVRCLSSKY